MKENVFRTLYFKELSDDLCLEDPAIAKNEYSIYTTQIDKDYVWCSDTYYFKIFKYNATLFAQVCKDRLKIQRMNNDLILKALSQYGVKEIVGSKHNQQILEYFKVAGHSWVKDDNTYSWCAAFVNWVTRECGYESTGTLLARDWLNVGTSVDTPEIGDIVIFWRISKDSVYGHVAFYISDMDDSYIYVLGGNQSNMVNISVYPKYRVLGYRRLNKKLFFDNND